MKILKLHTKVEMQLTFKDFEIDSPELLADVLLDFERQLNNLKLVSEVKPIGIYPRFYLPGDIHEYTFTHTGGLALEGRPSNIDYQQHELRVSGRQRQDSGVPEDATLQQGSGDGLPEKGDKT